MSISHAIVFVPVILALILSAALVSIAVIQSSSVYAQGGSMGKAGTFMPGLTGYVVHPDWQGLQEKENLPKHGG
jgi:hypothetical protein